MSKLDATFVLMEEARGDRTSNASTKRIVQACKTLKLNPIPVLQWLDIADENGNPYSKKIDRIW